MKFRKDINALRALAVIIVILFHLDFKFFTGGYIGVDIFFVISGYFISKSILYDINNNKFNFLEFYNKRIKRLFPALVFISTTTLIFGYFILTPIDYRSLAKSVFASNFFSNNFIFWLETGYFDALQSSKPLLHYWSLAVEFQFYLFFPLIIVFIKSKKLPIKISFFLIFLLSFITAILGNHYFTGASFYLLPFRLFEFSLGTLAVLLNLNLKEKLKKIIVFSSYIIIFGCCFFYKSPTFFSYYNLYPCLATFFIINLKSGGKFTHFISNNKYIQLIGKTSYSTYLVHWPLIVFYGYHFQYNFDVFSKVLLLLASFIIGFFVWKYIENILRTPKKQVKKIALSVTISCLLSTIVILNDGFSFRYPLLQNLITPEKIKKEKQRYWTKLYQELNTLNKYKKEVIIMGNSHAIDLCYAFIENGSKVKISFLATDHRCYNCNEPLEDRHIDLCNNLLEKNLTHNAFQTASSIYLHDHWPILDTLNLRNFLSKVRQKTNAPIYVFGPKLTFTKPAINIIYDSKSDRIDKINTFAFQKSEIDKKDKINTDLIYFFNSYKTEDEIYYIDVLKLQCGTNYDYCEIISKSTSKLLYFDKDHFTLEGSINLGSKLKQSYPEFFE